MEINKIKKAAEIAKAKTSDKRWINAINRAVEGVENGWIITELVDGIMVTTENGTYHANGVCQCKAYNLGQPCKHRALYRLIQIASEIEEVAPVATDERETLIQEITTTWNEKFPHDDLARDLMARFGVNTLTYLNNFYLRAVFNAIS